MLLILDNRRRVVLFECVSAAGWMARFSGPVLTAGKKGCSVVPFLLQKNLQNTG